MDLQELNSAQQEAVTTTEGPVMVMAGAGSGKTRVLTMRIAYLISELKIPSPQILAVTFTNKAAREMKERIAGILSIDTKYMWVSTFHSFCARVLRMEIERLSPYTASFMIIDEEDSIKIVKDIMKENNMMECKPKTIHNYISKAKNFIDFSIRQPSIERIYIYVYEEYEAYLRKNNLVDFDDLLLLTVSLFKKNPDILEKYQNKFQYILIDEFQDTNAIQYDLMVMLASRHHNIFVVGDDFQSIYSFRGARIQNINKFRKDFIETKLILLEENYRSTGSILNVANQIIENNPNQIKKKLFSNKKNGVLPCYYHADTGYGEVMFVIDTIRDLMARGSEYKDIAILYRANYLSRNFEDMLIRYQIPYKIYGALSFFSRKEIKDVIAYLRVLVFPDDTFSFLRIINEPKRKIGPSTIEALTKWANFQNVSLYESISTFSSKGSVIKTLKEFKERMDSIRFQMENVKLRDLVDLILTEMEYETALKKEEDTYEDRMENVRELKSVLRETEEYYSGSNQEKLEQFLFDLALRTDKDNESADANAVLLSTYHQVKGLEFDTVFMVAMEETIFPFSDCKTDEEIEEERRVCYVGITRAKERLYVTNAENRYLFGSQNYMFPSRFIKEMGLTVKKQSVINRNTMEEEKETVVIKTGDKINHKVFGDGVVVKAEGNKITVAFAIPYGVKELLATHPSIRKLIR